MNGYGKKKKMIVVSGGSDVPEELLKAIAEQAMSDEMGEEGDEMSEPEDESQDPLEKELMSVIKKIIESC